MPSNINKKLARLVSEEIWNKGNLAVADEILTQDIVRNDANWPEVRGLQMYKQTVVLARTAFPDWHERIGSMVSEGDMVACRITISATNTGDLLGNPPTGKHLSLPCQVMYRIAETKIAEMWTIWDALNFYAALGIAPLSPPSQ